MNCVLIVRVKETMDLLGTCTGYSRTTIATGFGNFSMRLCVTLLWSVYHKTITFFEMTQELYSPTTGFFLIFPTTGFATLDYRDY